MKRIALTSVPEVFPDAARHSPSVSALSQVIGKTESSHILQGQEEVTEETSFFVVYRLRVCPTSVVHYNGAESECFRDARTGQQEDVVAKVNNASLKLNDFKVMSVSKSLKGSLTLDVSVCKNT